MDNVLLIGGLGLASLVAILVMGFLAYRALRQALRAGTLAIRTANGVRQAMFVRIGGIEQWVQIRGEDRRNPVILVLHGGMAMSYMALTPAFRAWEKHFTVVQWDRRGVGKTFGRNGARGSGEMSLERIAADGAELAEFLRTHLGRRKIILMGHSMGSQIGVTMAARRPDLFHAYVATEQIIDMPRNEAVSYQLIGQKLAALRNRKALKRLEKLGPPPYAKLLDWGAKQSLAEKADPDYGRVLQRRIGSMLLYNPGYTLGDLVDFGRANQFSGSRLFAQWMAFDARRLGMRFELPIVVIQGEEDVMTPTPLVREWLDQVDAPKKDLVLLKAGHLSMMTAPGPYLDALTGHVRLLALEPDTPT
jgi:pimeloyl-ACP methyl ester carboxylesterase